VKASFCFSFCSGGIHANHSLRTRNVPFSVYTDVTNLLAIIQASSPDLKKKKRYLGIKFSSNTPSNMVG
jgi:hypothetical protein